MNTRPNARVLALLTRLKLIVVLSNVGSFSSTVLVSRRFLPVRPPR